jgi:hypothetical protein
VFLILDRYGRYLCLPTLQSRREGESRAAQRPEQPDGGNAVARRTQHRRGNAPKQTGVVDAPRRPGPMPPMPPMPLRHAATAPVSASRLCREKHNGRRPAAQPPRRVSRGQGVSANGMGRAGYGRCTTTIRVSRYMYRDVLCGMDAHASLMYRG